MSYTAGRFDRVYDNIIITKTYIVLRRRQNEINKYKNNKQFEKLP